MKTPAGVTNDRLCGGMKKQGVIISGGPEQFKGNIFRICTMGLCSSCDILRTSRHCSWFWQRKASYARGAGVRQRLRCWDR